jgi:hypothetical protein
MEGPPENQSYVRVSGSHVGMNDAGSLSLVWRPAACGLGSGCTIFIHWLSPWLETDQHRRRARRLSYESCPERFSVT